MNYKLSTYADRVNGKVCFVIESRGKILYDKINSFKGTNIKENALDIIYQGIKSCSLLLEHEDILVVEVQNRNLCDWLNGEVEYKDYCTYLDKVFCALELLDCRYLFHFVKSPLAKKYMKGKGLTQMGFSAVDDMMSEFDAEG